MCTCDTLTKTRTRICAEASRGGRTICPTVGSDTDVAVNTASPRM